MPVLDRLLVLAHSVSRAAIWSGGTLVLCAAILVAADLFMRNVFMVTFGGADELAGYAFAIGTAWALSFTLLNRANVRVDALYAVLPPRFCAVLDIIALIALGIFAGLLTWHAAVMLETSVSFSARATTPLQTPLWIPQILWVAGLAMFVVTLVLLLLRAALALLSGDLATVRRLAGARSIEESAAAETAHTATLKPLE